MYKKEEKGITLIALVITIIVLIILGAVTLVTLFGDNGIIKRAVQSRETTKSKSEDELVNLIASKIRIEEKLGEEITQEKLQSYIDEVFGANKATGMVNPTNYTVSVTDGETYKITATGVEKGSVVVGSGLWQQDGETITNKADPTITLEVGTIISNYNDILNGTTAKAEDVLVASTDPVKLANTTVSSTGYDGEWAVLGVGEEGTEEAGCLLLMSTKNIRFQNDYSQYISSLTLCGADGSRDTNDYYYYYQSYEAGWENAEDVLDNKCSEYMNETYANSVRSVRAEDINRITKYNPETNDNYGDQYKYMLNDNIGKDYDGYYMYDYIMYSYKSNSDEGADFSSYSSTDSYDFRPIGVYDKQEVTATCEGEHVYLNKYISQGGTEVYQNNDYVYDKSSEDLEEKTYNLFKR